jgi:hypothetical protein
MDPSPLTDRVETLIKDLMEEGGLASASLASILMAAQDSLTQGDCLELSRRVWLAANELRSARPVPLAADAEPMCCLRHFANGA